MERDLAEDEGVRAAAGAFQPPSSRREVIVTVLGVITAMSVIGSGHAVTWPGALVLVVTTLAVADARRVGGRAHQGG